MRENKSNFIRSKYYLANAIKELDNLLLAQHVVDVLLVRVVDHPQVYRVCVENVFEKAFFLFEEAFFLSVCLFFSFLSFFLFLSFLTNKKTHTHTHTYTHASLSPCRFSRDGYETFSLRYWAMKGTSRGPEQSNFNTLRS